MLTNLNLPLRSFVSLSWRTCTEKTVNSKCSVYWQWTFFLAFLVRKSDSILTFSLQRILWCCSIWNIAYQKKIWARQITRKNVLGCGGWFELSFTKRTCIFADELFIKLARHLRKVFVFCFNLPELFITCSREPSKFLHSAHLQIKVITWAQKEEVAPAFKRGCTTCTCLNKKY